MSDPFDGFDEEIEEMEEISPDAAEIVPPPRREKLFSGSQSRRGNRPLKQKPRVINVLHQTADFFIIDKPPGLIVEPDIVEEPSVYEQLEKATSADISPLQIVFPMQADTSGIVVVARHREAHEKLIKQLTDGQLILNFHAIVRARVEQDSGVIDLPLVAPSAESRATINAEHGQPAVTEWRVLDRFIGYALLECRPRTALHHQIRAHLQAAGMPLAVDKTYGGGDRLMLSSFKAGYRPSYRREELPLIRRLSLHATSVVLMEGAKQEFSSPYPRDFRASVHQLDRFGRIPKQIRD